MNGKEDNLGNITSPNGRDTYESVLTSNIVIFLGPTLISLCMFYMCINYCFQRRKKVHPSICDYARTRWEIDKQIWIFPLQTHSKESVRAYAGQGGYAGGPELSLTRFLDVCFPPSEAKLSPHTPCSKRSNESSKVGLLDVCFPPSEAKLSPHTPCSKRSNESRKVGLLGSWSKHSKSSCDDDVSTSHISLTSIKSFHRGESSTLRVFKGIQHVRAPSTVRAFFDELPEQQADCKSSNQCAPEASSPSHLDGELVVGTGLSSVEIFSQTISLKQFPSEGKIPVVQRVSHSSSHNVVQLPNNNVTPLQNDSLVSPDEDFKFLQTLNLKSETSIDISTQVEPSRTSNSITFLKTPTDKAQCDSEDHFNFFSPDQQHNDNDQNKPMRMDSVLHIGSGTAMCNSIIVNTGTSLSKFKINSRLPVGEEEPSDSTIKSQPFGDEADASEDSTYLIFPKEGEDRENSVQSPIEIN